MNADRILIAETEPDLADLYRRELRGMGYHVTCASGEADLLRTLREDPPDLVILDFHLGGLGTLDEIACEAPHVPVILTSRCDIRCNNDFRTWLAHAVIAKSSDLTELKQVVRSLLAQGPPSGVGRRLEPVLS